MALAPEKVEEIKQLLAAGKLSQRKISKLTGVSRVVIHRIATGKRKDIEPKFVQQTDEDRYKRPFERCPVCGGMVQMPCIACIVKSLGRDRPSTAGKRERLQLELDPEHHERYLQVRRWREQQIDPTFTKIPNDWPFL